MLPIASSTTATAAAVSSGAAAGTIIDFDTTRVVIEEPGAGGDVVVEERRGGMVMDMTGDNDSDNNNDTHGADKYFASSGNVHLYVHRGGGDDHDEVVFVSVVNESEEAVTCRVDVTACNYILTSPFVVPNTTAAAASSSSSSSSSTSSTKPPSVVRVLVALPPLSYRLVGILVATALDQGLPPSLALAPVPSPTAYTWVIGGNGGGAGGGGLPILPPSLVSQAIPSDQQILGFSFFSASPRSEASAGGNHHQQQKLVLPHFDPHALY